MISDGEFVEVVVILQRKDSLFFMAKGTGTEMKEVERLIKLSQKGGGQLLLLKSLTLPLKRTYMEVIT